ncbi:RNA-directed DNA polymerase [Curtobacterium sp. MCLR17_054]|uniref:RNA-directed DNA polymerase n=1 Tax=Curtobacterium sp. MCLR17_054 TaxID=2175632 RepID=UPI000DA8B7B7|nr:RNA-directed DNA polymerase [Curtobacterium sp. MCLR17_054]WIE68475.1 RNA-directed DNA polymerase [Curtobacterium sp. MCLR17_054]
MNFFGMDLAEAARLVESENFGDWYRDPWGWPELRVAEMTSLKPSDLGLIEGKGARWDFAPSFHSFEIPKSFFGQRPAVLLDPVTRLVFAAAVQRFAEQLEAELSSWSYGWRYRGGVRVNNSEERDLYRQSQHEVTRSAFSGETDITSFFASVHVPKLLETLRTLGCSSVPADIIERVLTRHDGLSFRSGLPQRSTASAILAQVALNPVDGVISRALEQGRISRARRWMDDISFEGDYEDVYRLLLEVQAAARNAGLEINASKTAITSAEQKALEFERADQRVIRTETDIVDDDYPDLTMTVISDGELLTAEDAALQNPREQSRTELGLVLRSLWKSRRFGRVAEWMDASRWIPHGADHLSRYLREAGSAGAVSLDRLNEWFVGEHTSDWPHTDWVAAQHATAIAAEAMSDDAGRVLRSWLALSQNAQKLAVAVQRLASIEPQPTRRTIRGRIDSAHDPILIRLLVLGLLASGAPASAVTGHLNRTSSLKLLHRYLDSHNWKLPNVPGDFAGTDGAQTEKTPAD